MSTRVVHVDQVFDVFIGRPSKWGNPFPAMTEHQRPGAILNYAGWILEQPELLAAAPVELKGKTLGCYCRPRACHGDVLAMLADRGPDALKQMVAFARLFS